MRDVTDPRIDAAILKESEWRQEVNIEASIDEPADLENEIEEFWRNLNNIFGEKENGNE
jgi:hypothetical protein